MSPLCGLPQRDKFQGHAIKNLIATPLAKMASSKDLVICHITSCLSTIVALASIMQDIFLAWNTNELRNIDLLSSFLLQKRSYIFKKLKRPDRRAEKA